MPQAAQAEKQTFTNVTPVAQTFTGVTPIDASSVSSEPAQEGFLSQSADVLGRQIKDFANAPYAPFEDAYQQYKKSRDAGKDVGDALKSSFVAAALNHFAPELQRANNIVDAHKQYVERREAGYDPVYAATAPHVAPFVGVDLARVEQAARTGNWKGVLAETAVPAAETAVMSGVAAKAGVGAKIKPSEAITPTGTNTWPFPGSSGSFESVFSRRLSLAEADTPRASGAIQPALNNTPREVLEHAAQEGIDLTHGQATESPLTQNLQKTGTMATIGGKDLANAIEENRAKFGQSVKNFMDEADPKRMGLSAESAGEAIQQSAKTAKDVAHENAAQNYQKIGYLLDSPVEGAKISSAWNSIKGDLPMGAEDNILSQTPRSMRATVEDLLSGKPEGFNPTVQQTIQLRKFFRDMSDTPGLMDKTQATYKSMEKAASGALDDTAAKNNATDDWNAANSGWRDYVSKYGDNKSPFYKILTQRDPTRIVTALQNAPATDILAIKNEGMDAALEPLRRQVAQDIAQNRFNVGRDGLGGYSDSYLRALFGPDATKELYLKADLARRLHYDPNPAGTAGGIQSFEQLTLGNQAKMATAAKLSMPKDPMSYLPPKQGLAAAAQTTPFSNVTPISQPLKVTNEMGIRWASDGKNKVSIPAAIPDLAIEQYARTKLAEQEQIHSGIKQRTGIQ